MAEFEIIEDIQKAIPKGKDLKKYTPFIVGGLGLGVVALFMNRRKPTQATPSVSESEGVGENVDLGGVLNDFANQTNQALQQNNQEMSYQLSEVAGNLFDVIGEQNAVISQLQEDLKNQPTDVYQEATSVQQYQANDQEDSGFSIYYDGVDDDIQYNNVVNNVQKAISDKKISSSEGRKIKKEIAGLGNDGVGYSEDTYKDNRERLAKSPDYVKSEIERANLVIENRKASGMSTKLQEEYKQRLVSGKEWTK